MGLARPADLGPQHVMRRLDQLTVQSYGNLLEWLEAGELIAEAPETWARAWAAADPDTFHPRSTTR